MSQPDNSLTNVIDCRGEEGMFILNRCAVCYDRRGMNIFEPNRSADALESIRMKLRDRFPEAHLRSYANSGQVTGWKSGIPGIDRMFKTGCIPYGQLIEVTGGMASGKTSLLMRMLAGEIQQGRVAYVDLSDMFYPDAAVASGLDLKYLLVVKPKSLSEALRTAEHLLKYHIAGTIVIDLVGQGGTIEVPAFHRLRTLTVRSSSMLFFLAEDNSSLIPPSMISMRFEISKKDGVSIIVNVSKSRISSEGQHAEVPLYES